MTENETKPFGHAVALVTVALEGVRGGMTPEAGLRLAELANELDDPAVCAVLAMMTAQLLVSFADDRASQALQDLGLIFAERGLA